MEEITAPTAAPAIAVPTTTGGIFSGFTGGLITGIGSAIAAYGVYRLAKWAVRQWRTATHTAAQAPAAPAAPAASAAEAAPSTPIQ